MTNRRVAITGLGAISPLGLTVSEMWDNICQGKSGIDTISVFDASSLPCPIAGEIQEYKLRSFVPKFHRKAVKLMSRDIELAVIAADEAFKSSGIVTKATDPDNMTLDPKRISINIGAGLISCDLIELAPAISESINNGEFDLKIWGEKGLPLVTPLWLLKYLPNMLDCHVGILHDIQGPGNSITCGEASSHLSISEASSTIKRNAADAAIAGGGEAKVNPIVLIRQSLMERTATQTQDPQNACKPFASDASGCVFGEGAGLVILEELEQAENRDAQIYAELVGCGESASHSLDYKGLDADGKGLQIAIEKAIVEAQISPEDIDLIIPHGTAIAVDDKAEATAIINALGEAGKTIPVLPTKSMLSNTGAASGGIDIIVAAMAMKNSTIPAAINCEKIADGCELNIVKETISKPIKYALICSYTYGGQTAAIILKKIDGDSND